MDNRKIDKLEAGILTQEVWNKETPYSEVLTCFEDHGFGDLNEFNAEYKQDWQPYSHKRVLQKLRRRKYPTIGFRDGENEDFFGAISVARNSSSVKITASRGYCEEHDVHLGQATYFLRVISETIEKFHHGIIFGEEQPSRFYNENSLSRVPACFGGCLVWMHFVHPSGYSKYLTREDILGMPAQEIQEWENGVIQVQMFDHPFNYDAPENRQIIIEATKYLNDRRLAFIKANSLER
ncbi:MAG: hypothetical protein AAGG51_01930 [Cyanobacteria bacterium P01_G01_bin.54]